MDTGCSLNLINECSLSRILNNSFDGTYYLKGVGKGFYETLCSVVIHIFERKAIFHIVSEDFGISTSGILGMEFLHENSATMKFRNGETVLDLPPLRHTNDVIYSLPPRSRKVISLSVENYKLNEGYIERIITDEGVIIPDGVVSCVNGKIKVIAINPTDHKVDVKIPVVEIQECDFLKVNHVDALEADATPSRVRLNRLLEVIDLECLSQEEEDSLLPSLE